MDRGREFKDGRLNGQGKNISPNGYIEEGNLKMENLTDKAKKYHPMDG